MKPTEWTASWPAQHAERTHPLLLFVRNFIKHPKMLGSPIPSSPALTNRLLKHVPWAQARLLVEYGPGVGSLTTEILRRMSPEATLIAIEMNGDFVEYLRSTVNDSRLHLVHGSAAEAGALLRRLHLGEADCVISGIPFSTMPRSLREDILRVTHAALRPEGRFLVYQYSQRIVPSLKEIFGHVRRDLLQAKLIPMWLFQCSR
ncbi:MAG TPA: methyltransferase [Verrucomicrobiae bacterium]|nr:methyltransferase [Verrucomicrobiae bacterium]